jgi:hypothetical protein
MEVRLQQLCELLGEDSNILQETAKGMRAHGKSASEPNNDNGHISALLLTSSDEEGEGTEDEKVAAANDLNNNSESSGFAASEGDVLGGGEEFDENVLFEDS